MALETEPQSALIPVDVQRPHAIGQEWRLTLSKSERLEAAAELGPLAQEAGFREILTLDLYLCAGSVAKVSLHDHIGSLVHARSCSLIGFLPRLNR
jgi:hypothetical protein